MSDYRQIVEEQIGRPLTSAEIVHHKNGKHWDDRPENLELTTVEGHRRLHWTMKRMRQAWAECAFARFLDPPKGYTYDETVELTRCTSVCVLAEIGELEYVELDVWPWRAFSIPSVDAFVARGGMNSLRAAS